MEKNYIIYCNRMKLNKSLMEYSVYKELVNLKQYRKLKNQICKMIQKN